MGKLAYVFNQVEHHGERNLTKALDDRFSALMVKSIVEPLALVKGVAETNVKAINCLTSIAGSQLPDPSRKVEARQEPHFRCPRAKFGGLRSCRASLSAWPKSHANSRSFWKKFEK